MKGGMDLNTPLVFPVGETLACNYAGRFLKESRWEISDHLSPDITHLLLDVPSFRAPGVLRSGEAIKGLLEKLPAGITVIGGNLGDPALNGYRKMDLLSDPVYLAKNAGITAHCALIFAGKRLDTVYPDTPTLIIGWGRIGKCLASLLRGLGTPVTVAARKEEDRAMLQALGYTAVSLDALPALLPGFRLIFNTAPAPVLTEEAAVLGKTALKIELASSTGIPGEDVIPARGLPGIYAPESSGRLIAETALRLWKDGT